MEMEFRYGSGGTEPMKIHRRRRDTKSTFIGQTCNYIVYSPIDFTSDPWSVTRIVIRKLFSQTDFGTERVSSKFRLSRFAYQRRGTKVAQRKKRLKAASASESLYTYIVGGLGSNVIHHRFIGWRVGLSEKKRGKKN